MIYIITEKDIEFCRSFNDLSKVIKYYIDNNIVYKLTSNINKVNTIKKELLKNHDQAIY